MPVQLPRWNDAHSVSLWLTGVFGAVVALLSFVGVRPPAVSPDVFGAAGTLVAFAAPAVNAITHRSAHAKAAQVKPWQAT